MGVIGRILVKNQVLECYNVGVNPAEKRRLYMREYMRNRRANDPEFMAAQTAWNKKARDKNLSAYRARCVEWKKQNAKFVSQYNKEYAKKNYEKISKKRKERAEKLGEIALKKAREWKKKNSALVTVYMREYSKSRYHADSGFRIAALQRSRISAALRENRKLGSTKELLGCELECLVKHLENQFRDGMSWSNKGEWHIDHIRPLASFDLSLKEEQLKAFNYKNLQPLWAADNLRKKDKIVARL